MTGDKDDDDN